MSDTTVERSPVNRLIWDFEPVRGIRNYKIWARYCKLALGHMGLFRVCEQEEPEEPLLVSFEFKKLEVYEDELAATVEEHGVFAAKNKEARMLLLNKCDPVIVDRIAGMSTAKEIWDTLKTWYFDTSPSSVDDTSRDLRSATLVDSGGNLDHYFLRFWILRQELQDMGVSITNADVISCLVDGLEGELQEFAQKLVDGMNAPGLEDIYDGLRDAGWLKSK